VPKTRLETCLDFLTVFSLYLMLSKLLLIKFSIQIKCIFMHGFQSCLELFNVEIITLIEC